MAIYGKWAVCPMGDSDAPHMHESAVHQRLHRLHTGVIDLPLMSILFINWSAVSGWCDFGCGKDGLVVVGLSYSGYELKPPNTECIPINYLTSNITE